MSADRIEALTDVVLRLLTAVAQRPERLRVGAGDVTVDLDWRVAATVTQPSGGSPAPAAAAAPAAMVPAQPQAGPPTHHVCASAVGTFYHSPSPGAAPLVVEGDVVVAGQQIGIIEAMKLMMPVESDRSGRVVGILVGDGKPVEYGEPLIALVDAAPGA